ncbi:MAG TPA: YihA family ribosome biogenesis GTP-binding protein [Bacteroidetes bacterium]|nr:YihA family ribosome biogenesis GTP-binding protein [Bacteroidota bacterium]
MCLSEWIYQKEEHSFVKLVEVEFERSVFSPEQFPRDQLPQIAFAGRSNVGKSSMINNLLQQKNLARISSRPGKTRSINFLRINRKFYFIDLPGYGYAKVPRKEREKWKWLIDAYFGENRQLRGLVQIIDSRVGVTGNDAAMIRFSLEMEIEPFIVATKADKLKQKERAQQEKKIYAALHQFSLPRYLFFSAKTNLGKNEVWSWIEEQIRNKP